MNIVFIINGDDYEVRVRASTPLYMARTVALEGTGNIGRPSADWDIYTEEGRRLAPEQLACCVDSGARLFLSLQVGSGGSTARLFTPTQRDALAWALRYADGAP